MATWNPTTYLTFADERSRPFYDLLERVMADSPAHVVDLGCGPGQLTATLADRWPEARIRGVDSSPQMIEAAAAHVRPHVTFELADLAQWEPAEPVDVILSNATLQWVPRHRELLPGLLANLTDDGWLAFQVPGNFAEPSHRLLRDLARSPRFASETRQIVFPSSHDPETYLEDLISLGCTTEVWETTYFHVLAGEDPVFRWIASTGARPVLQALDGDLLDEFTVEYKSQLRAAYPARDYGVVLPYRRVFCVAQKVSAQSSAISG
jgi:trans-aconitate 2-methyltransferase